MIRATLVLLLLAACDGPAAAPPSQPPPPTSTPVTADKPAAKPADKPDEGASFASPKQADDNAEPAPPTGPPPDAELVARIKERFGDRCRYERACGDLVGVDCDSAVDGPYYYVTRKDLTTVSTCGGTCRRGCTDCPPKAWTCPTY
jgi:hypothetical protein